MMDCYMLTLYVSVEQEFAIRELFVYNGWNFNKYEDSSFNYDSKQETGTCIAKKVHESTEPLPTKVIGKDSSMKNVVLDTSEHSEIFSDLEHFVEATLIAVTSDSGKADCGKNENKASIGTSTEICCIKSSCSPSDIKGTSSGVTGTREVVDDHETGIDVGLSGTASPNSIVKSTTGHGDDLVDVTKSLCGETGDSEMFDGSRNNTCIDKPFNGTTSNVVILNQPLLKVTNKDVICSKSQVDGEVNSGSNNFDIHNSTGINQSSNFASKGDFNVTKELNADEGKKCKEKIEMKKNVNKSRNALKEKKKLKKVKVENMENDDIFDTKTSNKKKSKVGVFHCKECNNTFRLLGAYKNHKRDGKCLFECEYCGKTFTSRYYSNYKSHLKYHLKERPHKCDICGKSYIEAQTLKIHMRKHSGYRPYVCHNCGLQFYSSSHLLSHRNSAHSDTRHIHKCDICDATLSTLGNLRVHKNVVHTVERPFTCEICGKTFKTQKSLEQIHAKVHSEDYPYKCSFAKCGKVFKRAEGLADHVRRHNNERNHFCERCGKGFYTNKDLLLHMRTHTGEKPHHCHLCDYKCALGGNLRKHMKTHQLGQLPLY